MQRIIAGALVILGISVLAAVVYFWTPNQRSFDKAGAIEAAKAYKARIIRDRFGVPHIYGQRNADVAFGLAIAHAQDDWATFEEVIRFSRGELARTNGKSAAVTDYLISAIGVKDATTGQYDRDISPAAQPILEGYAAGLNYFCATQKGACSKDIAPLTSHDIVAGFVSRQPFFYGFDEAISELFASPDEERQSKRDDLAKARQAFFRTENGGEFGSNAMAVAPARSADGHTRLMVNSHQPFTGPVAWYEARVKSEEGWDAIGALFPGSPFILVGTTPQLAWAFTVNKPDLTDVFELEVDNQKKPMRYRLDGQWREFERDEATFRVKLFGPFSLPVKRGILRTVHGPVFETPSGWYAVSFAGYRDLGAIDHYRAMNFASNYGEWRAAFEAQGLPSLNAVYADKTGKIGYFYNAKIPVRSSEIDWSRPAPGNNSALLWQGVRPFSEVPQIIDPQSGYVGNANNTPFQASALGDVQNIVNFPPHYGIDNRTTNRGRRLLELYLNDTSITDEEFIAYKMDDSYSDGSRIDIFVKDLIARPEVKGDPALNGAVELLASWDRRANKENRAAALAILTAQASLGYTYQGTDVTIKDPVEALKTIVNKLNTGFGRIDPEWGEVNRLIRGDVSLPLDGGPDTLRAIYSLGDPADGALTASFGDTYVMAVDWSPTGTQRIRTIHQFGAATLDPSSPHYADQTILFAKKGWKTPPMDLDTVLSEAVSDLIYPAAR